MLRRSVEVPDQSARFGAGHSFADVDFDSLHRRQIDYDAAIAHSEPEPTVSSCAYCQGQMLGLGKIKRASDIGRVTATHDHCGTPIECAVEDGARRVVIGSVGHDYLPSNVRRQFTDRLGIERLAILFTPIEKPQRSAQCPKRRSVECGRKRSLPYEASSCSNRHIVFRYLSACQPRGETPLVRLRG